LRVFDIVGHIFNGHLNDGRRHWIDTFLMWPVFTSLLRSAWHNFRAIGWIWCTKHENSQWLNYSGMIIMLSAPSMNWWISSLSKGELELAKERLETELLQVRKRCRRSEKNINFYVPLTFLQSNAVNVVLYGLTSCGVSVTRKAMVSLVKKP
jgi:hypothetical protein